MSKTTTLNIRGLDVEVHAAFKAECYRNKMSMRKVVLGIMYDLTQDPSDRVLNFDLACTQYKRMERAQRSTRRK